MAYTKTVWENAPSTATPINAAKMNNIEDGIEALDTSLSGGWISANETWVYASVDDPTGVITISGDKTTKYSLGMRIKFTNGGNVIYGIITKIAYSSPNTTLTFLHEIDPTDNQALYLMANSTITNNYYSSVKAPFGFPLNPDKWSIYVKNSTEVNQMAASANTWYNLGNIKISIPIGMWSIEYSALLYCTSTSGSTNIRARISLSTSPNSESSNVNTCGVGIDAALTASNTIKFSNNANKVIPRIFDLSNKTVFYLVEMTTGGLGELFLIGTQAPTMIRATCAYL